MTFKFTLMGVPIAKARPRFKRMGTKVVIFDSQKHESMISKLDLKSQMPTQGLLNALEAKVMVKVTFHMPTPKSWSQKRLKQVFENEDDESIEKYNGNRPDIDNLAKHVLDVMNGVIFVDDRQVVKLMCRKIYSKNPHTEIEVKEL